MHSEAYRSPWRRLRRRWSGGFQLTTQALTWPPALLVAAWALAGFSITPAVNVLTMVWGLILAAMLLPAGLLASVRETPIAWRVLPLVLVIGASVLLATRQYAWLAYGIYGVYPLVTLNRAALGQLATRLSLVMGACVCLAVLFKAPWLVVAFVLAEKATQLLNRQDLLSELAMKARERDSFDASCAPGGG